MRPLALLLLGILTTSAVAAERTASVSGDFADPNTWAGALPADTDTLRINDGVTVTVSDARAVGPSGPAGTVAIHLGNSGALVIADRGLLRARGDIVYTAARANTTPAITVRAGGTVRFDASRSDKPQETRYRFCPSADFGFRPFILTGTPDAHATLDSDPAGAPGCLTRAGHNFAGPFAAAYADITRIGDATTPGFDLSWFPQLGKHEVTWDVRHTTFTQCGQIKITGTMDPDGLFRHANNAHAATLSKFVFSAFPAGSALGKGTRDLIANVFDVAAVEQTLADDYTITGNYFGGGLNILWQSDPWAKCEQNFYRIFDQWCWVSGKRLADSVVFIDRDWDNPHVIFGTNRYPTDLDGLILSHAGTSNADSGEWIFVRPGCRRCIFLPNLYGYSSCEMTATGGNAPPGYVFEHNTWFGGYGKQWAKYPGFAAFQYSESGNNTPGSLKSFRSNILWNPQLPGKPAAFCKLNDVHSMPRDQKDGPPVQDVGNPDDIDFNTGWNYTPDKDIDFENKAHYKNWGKGYIGNFSRTPGQHDVDVDPQFLDYQRDVPLYATKALRLQPSRGEWSATPDKPYAPGDTVVHATTIEWGLPILYRYIGTGADNPEPGLGTREKGDTAQWRKNWEWATLHALREAIRTGQKLGDDDPIPALIRWIRAGYAPTNPALKGAAHDQSDIGAVPWQPKPR